MRFLITASSGDSPKRSPDQPVSDELFEAHMKFNEEMAKAGVLIASEGLNPKGVRARVAVAGGRRRVVDGPFTESKELVGGLYILEVKSKEEAIQWALRSPVGLGTDDVLDIYQLTSGEDLPPELVQTIRKVAPTFSRAFERQ